MENEARFTVAKAAAAQADSSILKSLHISTLSNARTRGNSSGFQLADEFKEHSAALKAE